MKKRVLSILAAVTMVLALFPTVASAEGPVTSADELTAALTAGGEVQLGASFTVETSDTTSISTETVLDLNGYTLIWNTSASRAIEVAPGGSLTICDRSTDQGGAIQITSTHTTESLPTGIYVNGGALNLESGTVSYQNDGKTSRAICVYGNASNFSMSGGTIVTAGQSMYGIYVTNVSNTISVTGGTIDIGSGCNANYGVYVYNSAVTVNNLTVDGSKVDEQYDVICLYGGSSKGILEVQGGTYIVNENEDSHAVKVGSGNPTAISDGTFTGSVNLTSGKITGGTFSVIPPAQRLGDGLIVQWNSNTQMYELVPGSYVARIGDVGYMDWDSLLAACPDSTVTQVYILSDVESITVPANKNVRLSNMGGWNVGTIINNGTCEVYMYAMPDTQVINNGTFTLSREVGSILNNAGATVTTSGNNVVITGTVTNHGTLAISSGKYIGTIVNDGAMTVTGGSFAQPEAVLSAVQDPYELYRIKDSTYGDLHAVYQASQIQAQVGDYYYIAWNTAAMNASAEQPAKLLVDLNLTPASISPLNINTGSDYYLDLNGHTITITGTSAYNRGFRISDGSLNLYNSQSERGGIVFQSYNSNGTGIAFLMEGSVQDLGPDHAVLRVDEGVKITSDAYSIAMASSMNYKYGVAVYFDGILETRYGPYINGQYQTMEGSIPVFNFLEHSVISSEVAGIYAAGYGEWNLAGSITGASAEALSIKSGVFNITGGIYTAGGAFNDPADANGNGSEATGAAISITSNDGYAKKTVVNVTGGTFISENGYAIYEGIAQKTDGSNAAAASYAELAIQNGNFTGKSNVGDVMISTATNKNVISGGEFSQDIPTTYLAPGMVSAPNSDGNGFTVSPDPNNKFLILNTDGSLAAGYQRIQNAVSALQPGQTLKLLEDVNNANTDTDSVIRITLPAGATLDGRDQNGTIHTISRNVRVDVNVAGGTIRDCNFEDIHNSAANLSAVYASGLAGELTITGCTFDNCDWDAIQTTPVSGAEIVITGNTFRTDNADAIYQVRYVHIESKQNVDFSATVTQNVMYDQLKGVNGAGGDCGALEIYYFTDPDKIVASGNYIQYPQLNCILQGSGENVGEMAYPMYEDAQLTSLTGVPVAAIKDTYTGTYYMTLAEAAGASESGDTITLLQNAVIETGTTIVIPAGVALDLDADLSVHGILAAVTGTGYDADNAYVTVEGSGKISVASGGYADIAEDNTYCTITFNSNGGICDVSAVIVKRGEAIGTLPTPTRSGYTFQGWFTMASGGERVTETNTVNADTTVYAQWTAVPVIPSDPGSSGSSSEPSYSPVLDVSDGGTIRVSPRTPEEDEEVTITVDPDAGYELGDLTVTDRNGREIDITANRDGTYTFIQPRGRVTIEATFIRTGESDLYFVDVPESAYYYDAVYWAVGEGITNGTTATTFSPNNACTRAQMVTFLWRAAGEPEPETTVNPFTDVSESAYYYEAVLWAVEQGITNGTTATTFAPNATVTRGQTVTFLWRNAGSPATGNGSFTDVAADAYYADAVAWAASEGITSGTTATTFSPNSNCTRAQIVTFLYRDLA